MLKKMIVAALAASMTLVVAAQAPAQTKKKKVTQPAATQEEKDAQNEMMEDLVFGVATGVLGGAMKKSKMPKGGKEVFKQGLKAVKNAKKSSDKERKQAGKTDSGKKKKASLSSLFAGGDDE